MFGFVVVYFQFGIDEIRYFVRIVGTERHQPQVIAQEVHSVMIPVKQGESLENRTVMRVFNMLFQCQHAFGPGHAEYLIHHRQEFLIMILLVSRTFEHCAVTAGDTLQDMSRVGNDQRANARSANNNKFQRLLQNVKMSTRTRIAARHADDNNQNTYTDSHLYPVRKTFPEYCCYG